MQTVHCRSCPCLFRLLESLHSADGLELARSVAERMLQELIEAEAAVAIGAGWNERSETLVAWRNGHRDKTLSTLRGLFTRARAVSGVGPW